MNTLNIFLATGWCHLLELFLWMLGSFILGWLLSRYFLKSKYQTQLDDCHSKRKKLESEISSLKTTPKPTATNPQVSNLGKSTKTAVASSFATTKITKDDSIKDDLKKVEGIGPKIQEHLNNDGIWSFAQLADSSITRLQGILDAAGPRYRIHNPKTWAQQAALARDGKWDELKKWQDELDGGK
ncbi:hypothetical protein [Urechidicola croceus]|uniref:LSU ribosomal protein L21p n=1 Tax=Urechidicola croceus TaxID=1850246 RepID=A0A1D8P5U1_9FLAO|nr:hypothetical protein [Urechidicola croceus]AOW19939.1 hypothetical protein LPB138_04235 [Urechidicola croceus]